jgi:hypothetical protein
MTFCALIEAVNPCRHRTRFDKTEHQIRCAECPLWPGVNDGVFARRPARPIGRSSLSEAPMVGTPFTKYSRSLDG